MKKLAQALAVALICILSVGCAGGAKYKADVVVIGAGGAGLAAANTAADNGVKVILIEKMPFAGGATTLAAGSITGTGTKLQAENGVEASAEEFQAELESEAVYEYDRELVSAHAGYSGKAIDFMADLGVEFFPELEQAPFRHRTKDPYQAKFVQLALDSLKSKGGEALLNTKATEILKDKDGSVSGVKAISDGKEITIAAKAVIIATGDFGANKEMLPVEYRNALNFGPVSSTGDGIKMAESLGAATVNMDKVALWGNGIEAAEGLGEYSWGRLLCEFGGIYVNTDGVRFSKDVLDDEEVAQATFEQEQAGKYVWVVFDQKIKDALHGLGFPSVVATWDAAKEATELEKNHNVAKADSITDLAAKIGVPAEALEDTLSKYNSYVETQSDPEFGRPLFANPIAEGPYYAMIQRVGIYPTVGGLKIDAEARVLNTSGEPIPGLYAAGDVTGGVSTNGRDTLVPGMSFGIIAGENAAEQAKQ